MSDKVFVDGLIVKEAKPEFVLCKLSFKVAEFIEYAKENSNKGWLNVDVCRSKNKKLYAKLDDWKPEPKKVDGEVEIPEVKQKEQEDLPF